MFGNNTNQIQSLMADYYGLVTSKPDDDTNCTTLKSILQQLDNCSDVRDKNDQKIKGYNLGYATIIPGPVQCTPEQQKLNLLRAHFSENVSRDFARNVTGAGIAIVHNKVKFFEILIDAYPDILFVEGSSSGKIDTALICAIDKRSLHLVSTVLSNIHFLKHEFNSPTAHLGYVNRCIEYTKKTYSNPNPEENQILQMLNSVLTIRIPLINAIKADNSKGTLINISKTCMSESFLKHKRDHTQLHKAIVEGAAKCAKAMCTKISSEEVSKLIAI